MSDEPGMRRRLTAGTVMYRRGCGKRVKVRRMCRPYLLNAVGAIRRRMMGEPGLTEDERAEDRAALEEMVRVADERGWGRPKSDVRS